MTDPATNPATTPTPDPLKALEEAMKSSSPATPAADAPPTQSTPANPDSAGDAADNEQRAQLKALEEQHNQADAEQLKAHIANLHAMTENAPQHEPETPAEPTTQQTNDADGYAIHQLTREKIQGQS